MPFYVYILQSLKDKSYYKGITSDPLLRLKRHNNGESFYSRGKVPWKLVYLELQASKIIGMKRERVLKKYSHSQIQKLILSPRNIVLFFISSISVD